MVNFNFFPTGWFFNIDNLDKNSDPLILKYIRRLAGQSQRQQSFPVLLIDLAHATAHFWREENLKPKRGILLRLKYFIIYEWNLSFTKEENNVTRVALVS